MGFEKLDNILSDPDRLCELIHKSKDPLNEEMTVITKWYKKLVMKSGKSGHQKLSEMNIIVKAFADCFEHFKKYGKRSKKLEKKYLKVVHNTRARYRK